MITHRRTADFLPEAPVSHSLTARTPTPYYWLLVERVFGGRGPLMVIRRRASAAISAAVLILSASLLAQTSPQQQPQRKLSDAEKKEIQTVLKIVDDAAAGQPSPNDLSLTWAREDLLKAQGNKQYLPFSVMFDPSKVAAGKLSVYWRVVAKDAGAAPVDAGKKDDRKDDKNKKPEYAYEDINTVQFTPGQAGSNRISRSFTVPPGNYDVYVVVKEPTPER